MADNEQHSVEPVEAPYNEVSEKSEPIFQNGQLTYLGRDIEFIPQQLIEDYCNITSQLDLSYNRLQSLKGLQHFKFLKELILDNNDLDDSAAFPPLKQLETLTLNKNKLTDLNRLLEQFCSVYPNLRYLSLLGNQACPNQLSSSDKDDDDYQRYRFYVLYKMQNLKFLDSSQVTPNELSEAKRVGPFMKVVRPTDVDEPDSKTSTSDSLASKYTPLPLVHGDKDTDHHQGRKRRLLTGGQGIENNQGIKDIFLLHTCYWGRNKAKYLGHNSEGNRFITDGIL